MIDDASPFRAIPRDAKVDVMDDSEQVVLTCGDSRSAEHYTVLLNRAYRQGFRAGYRAAKRNDDQSGAQ